MNIENTEEMDTFYKAVNILETLLKSKDAKLYFTAGQLSIKGDISKRKEILISSNIDEETFTNCIHEILKLIPYILTVKNTELFSYESDDTAKKFNDKCKVINKKLISSQIRKKYILEKTYKTNLIDKFDWSIISKYYDSSIDNVEQLSVAQLRFRIRHPFSDYPNVDKTETFIIECDIYDIKEIIEQLNKIKEHLEEIEEQKHVTGEE